MDIRNIDLQALDKEGLEQVKLMLDISKIQADIEMIRQDIEESKARSRQADATLEQMRLTNDKYLAETEKLRKENQWFPWLPIITTLLTGGLVVFLLTKLLQ